MADENPKQQTITRALTGEEHLAHTIDDQYQEAYLAKERLGLHSDWITYEDYYHGDQNPAEDVHDPASVTNIAGPIIDGMVADLVLSPIEILLQGWTTHDDAPAKRAQQALDWIWKRNKMHYRRDEFEYDREKFGTGIWKIRFDADLAALGMPIIESVSPFNFFPDPTIRDHRSLELGYYIIHAVPRSIRYLKRVYGSKANALKPGLRSGFSVDSPQLSAGGALGSTETNQVLLLERWTIEDGSNGHYLRRVVTVYGQPIILYDSDEEDEDRRAGYTSLYRFPFVVVPCYRRRGSLWGHGDVERMVPTQDLINDLDDQIRLNARLMGNLQVVVGTQSGINPYLWTNEPGLKIPARIADDWQPVQPQGLPPYIEQRRNFALTYESEFISGRSDVAEGRRPGSLRAASAILALQEAASKRINHKRRNTQWGLEEAMQIVLNYVTEFWTDEVELGEEIMFKGSEVKEIPMLDEEGDPTDELKPFEYDITVNVGEGLPTSKAFIYQAVIEGMQYGLVTPEEGREVMKTVLNFPVIDPYNPFGKLGGVGQQPGGPGSEEQQAFEHALDAMATGIPPTSPFPGGGQRR